MISTDLRAIAEILDPRGAGEIVLHADLCAVMQSALVDLADRIDAIERLTVPSAARDLGEIAVASETVVLFRPRTGGAA